MFHAPHGAVCAAVLPHAMETNVRALRARAPESQVLDRYGEIARLLTGNPQASAEDGVEWVAGLCRRLEIPPLRTYGVSQADVPVLVEKAAKASSMKGNPIALTEEELAEIIGAAI
jgi:alcohol dehydrogenase class IV